MSKHTPGLWVASKGIEDEPERWCVTIDGPNQFLIAVVENGAPGDTLETEEANARLIAAAPDLLAACKEAAWACSGEEYDPERYDKAVALCKAAIAKATK